VQLSAAPAGAALPRTVSAAVSTPAGSTSGFTDEPVLIVISRFEARAPSRMPVIIADRPTRC